MTSNYHLQVTKTRKTPPKWGKNSRIFPEPSNCSGVIKDIGETIATQYRLVYTTPRLVDDGTRRKVSVEINGSRGEAGYLEPHLINLKSNLLVGMVCLLPLLVLLLLPALWKVLQKSRTTLVPAAQAQAGSGAAGPRDHSPVSGR